MLLTNLFQNLFRQTPSPSFQSPPKLMTQNPFRQRGDINVKPTQHLRAQYVDPQMVHYYDITTQNNDPQSQFWSHADKFNKIKPTKKPINFS